MKFSRIYRETSLVWKRQIDISDGKIFDSECSIFLSLSTAWDQAQCRAARWSEWHKLMVWCIFNGYHRLARDSFEKEENSIVFEDIDKKYVERCFSEHLSNSDTGYGRQMKRAYKNDLKP